MSEETKQRILEAGLDLVHLKGFNNTGLKDILRAANVPKGSFYFYFDSKEAFGIEMVKHFRMQFREMINNVLENTSLGPLEQLRSIMSEFRSYFKAQGYTRGCLIGNLCQEMGDLSEPFRAKLSEELEGMVSRFAGLLEKAQAAGEIPADLDPYETAIFMVEAWHGALIRMKVAKTDEPLAICDKFIFDKLLK